MKLVLIADFDIGVSFGLDDSCYNLNDIVMLPKYNDVKIFSPKEEYSYEKQLQIGHGIRFDLLHSVALEYLKQDIISEESEDGSVGNFKLLLENSEITKMYLDIFPLGGAVLRIDFAEINSKSNFMNIDLLDSIDGFDYCNLSKYLKVLIIDFLFLVKDPLLMKNLTNRFDIRNIPDDELLCPTMIAITEPNEEQAEIRELFLDEYEEQSEYISANIGIGKIYFGWVSMVIENNDNNDIDPEVLQEQLEDRILNLQIMFISVSYTHLRRRRCP